MFACVLVLELRIPLADSLKAKRAVITPMLDGARRRHKVASSEIGRQDNHQHSELAFATVASSEHQAREILDATERFLWSFPEVEIVSSRRAWVDREDLS